MANFLSGLMSSLPGFIQQSGDQWEGAERLAVGIASEGRSEANVDPLERMKMEQLCRVAELRIAEATGLELTRNGRAVELVPVTRTQWVTDALPAYRPLFEQLTASLRTMMASQLDEISPDDLTDVSELLPGLALPGDIDPAMLLAGLSSLMGPALLTMLAGSTIGHLATRSFGCYDLPLPRAGDTQRLSVIAPNIDGFAADWSLPPDDVRLWVCLNELAHHAVLGVPHVERQLTSLLGAHASAFRADPEAIGRHLGDADLDGDADVDRLQSILGDPELALGAMRSPEQEALLPALRCTVAMIEGYVDHVVDLVGSPLVSSYPQVTEALRRRRVEADQATRFIEQLFGLELTTDVVDAGRSFIDSVVERAGHDGLAHLWSAADHLPTPVEIDQPGLWLARVGLEGDLPELDGSFEVPDFPDLDG